MARKETAIEDALFQIKNLEEALNKNAKGILSSTMKEEISSLVKESLKEQDEVDTETETEVEVDNEDETGAEEQDTEMVDTEVEDDEMMEPPVEPEDDTIDLTQASDEEVLKVFKAMGDNDGVIVKKDNNMLHLSDTENNTDYLIQLGESEEEMMLTGYEPDDEDLMEMTDFDFEDEDEDEDFEGQKDALDYEERAMNRYFSKDRDDDDTFEDEYDYKDTYWGDDENEMGFDDEYEFTEGEAVPTIEPEFASNKTAPVQETIYELELDDESVSEMMELEDMDMDFEDMDMDFEGYDDEEGEDDFLSFEDEEEFEMDESWMNESKKAMKAKGMGMGNASKFKYGKKPNQEGGFNTKMKQGTKGVGMGKAKFEYKEEVNDEGFGKKPSVGKKPAVGKKQPKKVETKEASRTLGNGKYWGREGLDKPRSAPRHLRVENLEELELLRAKNEEYRKALDLFRTKLNEVAIFNSNLAYATRLFTEHSTTKQEKINILRRFDNVDTLKESKNLYRVIKSELGTEGPSALPITESVQRTVERTPSTGSAVNLIESKTYENPQFLRMKDLMTKIK